MDVGAHIGPYRIERLLGRGGMGEVWLATDEGLARPVALKLLAAGLAADPSFRTRFLAESRLAASLDHPHIVPIYEAGEADGRLFIAMRYVEGRDLGSVIEQDGPLEAGRLVALLRGIADALDAAHDRGLVHRDVKPGNILVSPTARGGEHAYLADFGLTKQLGSRADVTRAGQIVGSLGYIAPEQIEGRPIDGRTDVYSLGCVLYEALTGRPPFAAEHDVAILWAHLQAERPRPSDVRPELETFDEIIARGLAVDPAERFASAGEILAAMERRADEAASGSSDRGQPAGSRSDRRQTTLPERDVRKMVTILAADLRASTVSGGSLDPEAARAIVGTTLAELETICASHGGTVETVIGDAILAVFGIPRLHEDDALRAARAAVAIRDRVGDLSAELEAGRGVRLEVRMGLNTGAVLAGDSASGRPLVSGDAVNVAARLQQAAEPGEVLLGVPTLRLVRDAVDVEPEDATPGGSLPIPAWRLVDVRPGSLSHVRSDAGPFLGRDRDLRKLRSAWDDIQNDRRPQLFTVLGTAGVGKSRLVTEFQKGLDPGTRVLAGTCLSYGDGITYWPLREVVHAAAGISETDGVAGARARLDSILADERDGAMVAGLLAAAIGLSDEAVLGEEIPWAARKLLEALARRTPLVVVWDDLHWAEPAFLDLIEHVADLTRDLPILLLCMARPEFLDERPAWGGGRLTATTILLEPLASDTTGALLAGLPGGSALPDELRARIAAAAEGNPLYLEELLGMLVDEGRLVPSADGGWTTAGDLGDVLVPPTILALLASRLELLPDAERALAERASVVGRVFETGAVRELSPEPDRPDLTTRLLSLVRKDLIGYSSEPGMGGEDAYRFRHLLIRDAAYEALPKAERAALHERFADWLEHISGDRGGEYGEILAHHLEQARRYWTQLGQSGVAIDRLADRAADALLQAGSRAYERGDQRSAADALGGAWSIAGRSRDQAADIFARYCAALRSLRRLADLASLVETSRAWAGDGDDRLAAWHRLQTLLLAADRVGPEKDIEALRRLDARFADLGDDLGRALTLQLLGAALTRKGALAAAVDVTREGIAAAARAGSREREMRLQVNLLDCLFVGPTPLDETEREIESLLERTDLPRQHRAFVSSYVADVRAMRGDLDGARRTYDESIAVCQDMDPTSAPVLVIACADMEMRVGDVARARQLLLPMADESSSQSVQWASAAGVLAVSSARLGDLAEARGWIERAGAGDALEDRALLLRARSLVAAGAHQRDEAVGYAEASLAAALDADRILLQADALRHLGELARSFGEADVDGHLEAALRLYELKGDLVSAERVRTALETSASAGDPG